jgi:hypothetical protein
MTWDRINKLELDLTVARRAYEDNLVMCGELLTRAATVTLERDRAREVACRLEEELAHMTGLVAGLLDVEAEEVDDDGVAFRRDAYLAQLRDLVEAEL